MEYINEIKYKGEGGGGRSLNFTSILLCDIFLFPARDNYET